MADFERRRSELLGTTIRRLLRRGGRAKISRLLAKERPEDVAVSLRRLTPTEQFRIFEILVADHLEGAGEVLTELEPEERMSILGRMKADTVARLLKAAAVDDAVFLVDSLPEELKEEVLEIVDLDERLDTVQEHLAYDDESAGRIMDTEFLALEQDTTVGEAIERIRALASEVEMISYLYVIDTSGHLMGVVTLRQLLLSQPGSSLEEVMNDGVVKVRTDTDQEEVAKMAARYDLLAIPVTDDDNKLAGIVTVDDILDVFKDEATEDFFKMAGTSDDELIYEERTFKIAGIRLPWLLVNLVGLLVAGWFTIRYEETYQLSVLIGAIPVIMGMAGNIGSQTATIAVRGLATGRLGLGDGRMGTFVGRQVKVGVVLGSICGLLVATVNVLLHGSARAAILIGPSVFFTVVLASLVGAAAPGLFERFGVDPAVASGPLVTTINDVLGIAIYFSLTALLFGMLA